MSHHPNLNFGFAGNVLGKEKEIYAECNCIEWAELLISSQIT
jgi:hypothetical protein